MYIDSKSPEPHFEPGHRDGVIDVTMNAASGHSLARHLRAAIERQKEEGAFVQKSLIAFAEQLAAAAMQAAGVLAGEEAPTDLDRVDDVQASPAPFFSCSVADDGLIDVCMTTKLAHMLSKLLLAYRDWRREQGFALPGDIAAFGAAMGNLARIARPVVPSRPVVRLPEEPAGSPLARFLRPQAG